MGLGQGLGWGQGWDRDKDEEWGGDGNRDGDGDRAQALDRCPHCPMAPVGHLAELGCTWPHGDREGPGDTLPFGAGADGQGECRHWQEA